MGKQAKGINKNFLDEKTNIANEMYEKNVSVH